MREVFMLSVLREIKITSVMLSLYLGSRGINCPYCESEGYTSMGIESAEPLIRGSDLVNEEFGCEVYNDKATNTLYCNACDGSVSECYTLTGIESLKITTTPSVTFTLEE